MLSAGAQRRAQANDRNGRMLNPASCARLSQPHPAERASLVTSRNQS